MLATKQIIDKDVLVGVIIAPVGVRGNVRIKYFTEKPEDLENFSYVFDANTGRPFKISLVSFKKDYLVAKIDGVSSRNDVMPLVNTNLYVKRSELETENQDEYLHSDLIGLAVYDEQNVFIGNISAVMNYGASDIIEIVRVDSHQSFMLPFSNDFIGKIDLDAGFIVISVPEEIV